MSLEEHEATEDLLAAPDGGLMALLNRKEELERASITHRTNGEAARAVRMSTPRFIGFCRIVGVETPQELSLIHISEPTRPY